MHGPLDTLDTDGYIQPDGSLGGEKVLRRETLYLGLNGNRVERFWDARRSYIYKPVGFPKTAGRERWVARRLKPLLEGIRMPEIVASSDEAQSPEGTAWIIYEDLGELRPPRTAADAATAAGWAAAWHRLPPDLVPESFDGHTPKLAEVAERIGQDPAALEKRLTLAGVTEAGKWASLLPELARRVFWREVVCHGDYYPGNIAMNFPEPVVLDWEFVHRNHPYWDLYCLMDITSYRYRKIPLGNRGRVRALRRYLDALAGLPASGTPGRAVRSAREMAAEPGRRQRDRAGRPVQPDRLELARCCRQPDSSGAPGGELPVSWAEFVEGYAIYASVYSAWILGLVEQDLAVGRAGKRRLERQWRETAGVLKDCLALLGPDIAKGGSEFS